MTVIQGLTVLAAVGSGMLAGLYTIFSIAIMPGLADQQPEAGMRAMQAINVRILNPLFLLLFMGAPVVGILAAVLGAVRRDDFDAAWAWWLLVAGAVLVDIGSLVVTMVANVPRNNTLVALDPASPEAEAGWGTYLREWTRWNHVRAVGCVLATACFTVAALGI